MITWCSAPTESALRRVGISICRPQTADLRHQVAAARNVFCFCEADNLRRLVGTVLRNGQGTAHVTCSGSHHRKRASHRRIGFVEVSSGWNMRPHRESMITHGCEAIAVEVDEDVGDAFVADASPFTSAHCRSHCRRPHRSLMNDSSRGRSIYLCRLRRQQFELEGSLLFESR